jgi:hypothetical protein
MASHDRREPEAQGTDRIDRRGFLKCMAWAGTSMVWTISGGLLSSCETGTRRVPVAAKELFFVQISDSHIGFAGAANKDVTGTFARAISQINSLPTRPAFVMHTGDLTHGSTNKQFDTVRQMFTTIKTGHVFQIPGEHDALQGGEKAYLQVFGKGSTGSGYYSFDMQGVHFLALVNSVALEGPGRLGAVQLDWIRKDLAGRSAETPLVVFAHYPLFALYPRWGWSTDDAAQALDMMKRFASVNVLNGHVHQIMSKTEGNVTFHTARAMGYPLPPPGSAPAPAPLMVPSSQLHAALGIREATLVTHATTLAIKDDTLAAR